jgi:hypothetical protein
VDGADLRMWPQDGFLILVAGVVMLPGVAWLEGL